MSTSSEAVMVSPEQCATAPKAVLKSTLPAQPPSSPARLVVMAVLALAAATGAMFGVVVFGNEFTKDVRPKGSSNMNSVTLVDLNDRAIATADVESYVSLLDLPLLGTAELNKIDGITYSTHAGVQHRKVTGYDVTKETTTVGGAVVGTPHLSLTTSMPDVTIEVSVRDSKAWVLHSGAGVNIKTAIETTSTRRLGAGSCLANGACLYSRDELLQVNADTRELAQGSFFARADVAAYQVDLSGDDVMQFLGSPEEEATFLDGTYVEDDSQMRLRVAVGTAEGNMMLFTNLSSGISKMMTQNGTWVFDGDKTTGCVRPTDKSKALLRGLEPAKLAVSGAVPFDVVTVDSHSSAHDFIPARFSSYNMDDCLEQMVARSNLTNPAISEKYFGRPGNAARKLGKDVYKPLTHKEHHKAAYHEMRALMSNPNNDINRFWASDAGKAYNKLSERKRKLGPTISDSDMFYGSGYGDYDNAAMLAYQAEVISYMDFSPMGDSVLAPNTYISHFDLWVCTRLADPTFLYNAYAEFDDMPGIVDTVGLSNYDGMLLPSFLYDFTGTGGISMAFLGWALFTPVQATYEPDDLVEDLFNLYDSTWFGTKKVGDDVVLEQVDLVDIGISKTFYHAMYPGSCSGGYEYNNMAEIDGEVGADLCMGAGFLGRGSTQVVDKSYFTGKFTTPVTRKLQEEQGREGRALAGWDSTDSTGEVFDTVALALEEFCIDLIEGDSPEVDMSFPTGDFTFSLKQGNSWASYLVKDVGYGPEYVVAFQGTKATDHSMIQYNLRTKPVFTYIGEQPAIIPEGQYEYVESLVPCLVFFIDPNNGWGVYPDGHANTQPTFITGHSLGGAAATLFARGKASWSTPSDPDGYYPRLVTFGAAPNSYRAGWARDLIVCKEPQGVSTSTPLYSTYCSAEGDSLSEAGYAAYASYIGGMSNYCSQSNQDSIRFFHKFDPIPSIAMWYGKFGHATEYAIMLYDMPDAGCESDSGCAISAASLDTDYTFGDIGLDGTNPFMIKDYLCDKWAVEPKAVVTECLDMITSYMSFGNPWPCGQIITMRVWQEEMSDSELASIGTIDVQWGRSDNTITSANMVDLEFGIFQKFEEYVDCVSAYEAALIAYVQSSIIDLPELAGALFSFTWIHSTYGYYPLCTTSDGADGILSINVDSSDLAKIEKNGCDTAQKNACAASCGGNKATDEWCMWDCMYSCYYLEEVW
jgi:hypothetical protein